MKEHIQAQLVNELRDVAKQYEGCECLRGVISGVVQKYIAPVREEISQLEYRVRNIEHKNDIDDDFEEVRHNCEECGWQRSADYEKYCVLKDRSGGKCEFKPNE